MSWGDLPYGLRALPALLLAIALITWLWSARKRRIDAIADSAAWSQLVKGWAPARRRRRVVLVCCALALLVASLARPQWGIRWEEVRRRGLDMLVVLDLSRSMLAPDLKPTRLQQAKWGIRDLVRTLRGDRIGLVSFAGTSFLQCPLTIDYAAFLMAVNDAEVGLLPRGGTDIPGALRTAIDAMEKQAEGERVILLITDGENHEGSLDTITAELREKKIRVFAVGVGTAEGELLPDADGAGFQKSREGAAIKTRLQEAPLLNLAVATGGAYVRSVAGDIGLDRLMKEHIAPLARQERESSLVKVGEERAGWFLGAALLLLVVEALMRDPKPKGAVP